MKKKPGRTSEPVLELVEGGEEVLNHASEDHPGHNEGDQRHGDEGHTRSSLGCGTLVLVPSGNLLQVGLHALHLLVEHIGHLIGQAVAAQGVLAVHNGCENIAALSSNLIWLSAWLNLSH